MIGHAARIAAWACAGAFVALAGCAKEQPLRTAVAPPTVRGGNNGLEVRWWVADDTDGAVGKALAAYATTGTPALNPALAERWELNGFRAVRIPVAELEGLPGKLKPIGPLRNIWLGWARQWTEVMRARRVGPEHTVIVNGQPRALPAGTTRFIARSWTTGAGEGATLRLELATQIHEQASVSAMQDPFVVPTFVPVEQQGEVFRELTWAASLGPEDAVLITAERPLVRWEPATEAASAEEAPESEAPTSSAASEEALFGPPVESPVTLGQAMLAAPSAGARKGPVKVVVVIVPRVPER